MKKTALAAAARDIFSITDPDRIQYSVRVSSRARRVQLKVRPFVGLEVVVPRRFPRDQIGRILQQHQAWITAQLDKHSASLAPVSLPQRLHFELTGEYHPVEYGYRERAGIELQQGILCVTVNDPQVDVAQSIKLLRGWVRRRAQQVLPARLAELADEFGFSYQKCSIRSQKSRWGSCSSNGTISLNDQLMFMHSDTADYLLIHELCHTRHMNHSAEFWKLVARYMPEFRHHEQALDQGRQRVPAWFLQDLYRA